MTPSRKTWILSAVAAAIATIAFAAESNKDKEPTVIDPGPPPSDAIVLFNGKDTSQLYSRRKGDPEKYPSTWKIENGELVVDGGDHWTHQEFSSCQLHLEWKSSVGQKGSSQQRGNGGVFFMDRYESQMLDAYDNPSYADGITGAVYGQTPPMVNAVHKPGEWQTYDIVFTAPKLKNGKVVEPARITTFVNGVCVQNGTAIMGPTMHSSTSRRVPPPVIPERNRPSRPDTSVQ